MPNGTTTSYSYDSLSRLLQLQTLKPNLEVINNNTYTYDNVGNKLSKQDSAGSHNYTYDNTYQLTQATHPPQAGQPTEAFAYDAVGNRTNTTVDAANKLLQDPNATYQYDNNGNRYIKTQTDGTTIYYSYDYEGRLTRVETQKPGLTTIAIYKYDALGRRIEKNVDGVVTRYLYSNEGLIAEYDINNNLKKSYGWLPNGIWGTDPLYMTENNQTYYYHNDALGTPQKMTDASGTVVWSATYTSLGEATIDPSPTITNNLRFAGQYFDQETGNHYNLNRYYDPSTGKYMTKDPSLSLSGRLEVPYLLPKLLSNPRELHPYLYTVNNPVNHTDHLGLEPSLWDFMGTDDSTIYPPTPAFAECIKPYTDEMNKEWNECHNWLNECEKACDKADKLGMFFFKGEVKLHKIGCGVQTVYGCMLKPSIKYTWHMKRCYLLYQKGAYDE